MGLIGTSMGKLLDCFVHVLFLLSYSRNKISNSAGTSTTLSSVTSGVVEALSFKPVGGGSSTCDPSLSLSLSICRSACGSRSQTELLLFEIH